MHKRFAYINKKSYLCAQIKCYGIRFERLRCEARAFFFVTNCPYFANYVLNSKNSTFLSKNSGKNLHISKNVCTFALEKLTKQYKTMKKQTFNRIFWAFVALGLCTLVCVQWLNAGCGWQSLVIAAAFYCALCFGGYVLVDDILEERR